MPKIKILLFLIIFLVSSISYLGYTNTALAVFECNVDINPKQGYVGITDFTITGTITKGTVGYAQGRIMKDEWVPTRAGSIRPDPIDTFRLDVNNNTFSYKTTFSTDPSNYVIGVGDFQGSDMCESSTFKIEPALPPSHETISPQPNTICNPTTCNAHDSRDPSKWTCDDSTCKPDVLIAGAAINCTCVHGVVTPPPSLITPPPPPCKNGFIQGTTTPCTNAGGLGCWSSNGQLALGDGDGVMTAIGCIPTEPTILVQNFLKFATGISGAIALLLMILGTFQMITSQGNPETVKKGQEQFTSAVIGLLFIIFSVLLLQVVGVDILQIPGLGQ